MYSFLNYIGYNIKLTILGISSSTSLPEVILIPTKIGAVLSSVLFIALTVFEFDRTYKYKTEQIIEQISNPVKINLTRILGLIYSGLISVLISMIIMIPHYIYSLGDLGGFNYYIISYILIIGGAIIFSIMMSAEFYLIFRHPNITYIIWVQTAASGFSEYFGDGNTILGMFWNRLFGFLVSAGILLAGFLCNRCYDKGIFKSFAKNCQKYKLMPICFVLTLCSAVLAFKN